MFDLTARLDALRNMGQYRSLIPAEGLDFSSNDYLGLAQSAHIRQALIDLLQEGIPLGSTGSRLLSGNQPAHETCENFLAKTFTVESALLFSSGYMANLAVLSAMGGAETEYFSDQFNHTSLIDGMHLSRSRRNIFRHNDMKDLRARLQASSSPRKIIVTETVFSMDGDLAPLSDLLSLAEEFDAWLILDEAHATGIFNEGLGRWEGVRPEKLISIHTAGKALGAEGAFVLSVRPVREFLINRARGFIYTTAISPLNAHHIRIALAQALTMHEERQHLMNLAANLRQRFRDRFDVGRSESQIIPVVLGSNEKVMRASQILRAKGLDVRAIRSPTVAPGTERLRISLKSFHQNHDLDRLEDALCDL